MTAFQGPIDLMILLAIEGGFVLALCFKNLSELVKQKSASLSAIAPNLSALVGAFILIFLAISMAMSLHLRMSKLIVDCTQRAHESRQISGLNSR
jgi:hypothetical protein